MNMNETLFAKKFLAEHEGLSAQDFFTYLKNSNAHLRSSSAEFKRQLRLFGFSYSSDDDLVDFIISQFKARRIFKKNLRDIVESIVKDDKTPSEENLYALCFALSLDPAQTQDLFRKAFGLRGFNFRNVNDVVFYHCLLTQKSYWQAIEFIRICFLHYKSPLQPEPVSSNLETSVFQEKMLKQLAELNWANETDVIQWIEENSREFTGYSRTAVLRYMQIVFELRWAVMYRLLELDQRGQIPRGNWENSVLENLPRVIERADSKLSSSAGQDYARFKEISARFTRKDQVDAWDALYFWLLDKYGDEQDEEKNLTFQQQYAMAKSKYDFMRPFLPMKHLFWQLFRIDSFGKQVFTTAKPGTRYAEVKQKGDQIPGIPNFMIRAYWDRIDVKPELLTARDPISNPASAREWKRFDTISRKVLIVLFFYQFIIDCIVKAHIPKGTRNHFYSKLNSLLKECGYSPLYERNFFDCIILAGISDFEISYAECPEDYMFSDDFFNEVIELNSAEILDSWHEAEDDERTRFDKSKESVLPL